MGIKDLTKFLRKEVPHAFRNDLSLNVYGTSVCIDVPIFAHKFCQTDNSTANLPKQFQSLVRDLCMTHGFTKIYLVFDGNKTKLKERERQKRKELREKYSKEIVIQKGEEVTLEDLMGISVIATPEDLKLPQVPNEVIELTETLEITVERVFPTFHDQDNLWNFFEKRNDPSVALIKATQEAEAMCARLVRENHAQICVTEDSDSLAFLCPRTVLQFRKEGQCIVDLAVILESLQMSPSKFQDFCILLGCDFAERLPLVGPAKLLKLHQQSRGSDLREMAYLACKNSKAIIEHRNEWAFVKQFFETCGFEINDIQELNA